MAGIKLADQQYFRHSMELIKYCESLHTSGWFQCTIRGDNGNSALSLEQDLARLNNAHFAVEADGEIYKVHVVVI